LIGTSEAVEHASGWKGKRGALTELLLRIGFIDLTPRGYEIHDLMDHAPDYVVKRKKREDKRRQRPVSDWSVTGRRTDTDQHSHSVHCALCTEPPTPCSGAAGGGSQATDGEQPNEPLPPEAAEFFASVANIGKAPGKREVDHEERRAELDRQKLVILGSGS
jgi:hypothetical protein